MFVMEYILQNLGLCAEIGQVLAIDEDSTDTDKLVYSALDGVY